MKLRAFVILTLTLTISGCGPLYNTEYVFTPPTSQSGMACIYQCENVRGQCRQIEEMRKYDCQRRADYERERCITDISIRKGRDPKWYECGTESCSEDYEMCDEQYRSCYSSCGGSVVGEVRCVANCPPPGGLPPAK